MEPPVDPSFARLQHLAALLGWPPLHRRQHMLGDGPSTPVKLVTWYESGGRDSSNTDCFLQFNESPVGQTRKYVGAVFAIRFRLFTGWRAFALPRSQAELAAEAARLGKWLRRDWFDSAARRREFRLLHPDCTGYSWAKVREVGMWMPPDV